MQWNFIIPDPDSFPSGGNIYNRQIVDALKRVGEEVLISPLELEPISKINADLNIWDTIYLDQMRDIPIGTLPGRQIMLIHHLQSMYPGPAEYFKQIELPILKQMDAMWVTSHYSKDYLRNHDVSKPAWIIPPIFNGPKFNDHKAPADSFIALIASNLVERKGVLPFLKLLSLLEDLPDFKIFITGNHELEPDYANACMQYVNSGPLRNWVSFLGPIPREDLFLLYHEADLYISTSFFETFGMSIQEALYYGTPVLAIRGGNTPYLVGISGWCTNTPEALVEQLEKLIRKPDLVENKKVDYSNWTEDWLLAAKFLINKACE